MRTSAEFEEAVMESARHVMNTVLRDGPHKYDEWTHLVQPLFDKVVAAIAAGLQRGVYYEPVQIGGIDWDKIGESVEAMAWASVSLFQDDDESVQVESERIPLSTVMVENCFVDKQWALDTIAAVERSCVIARAKVAAKEWDDE